MSLSELIREPFLRTYPPPLVCCFCGEEVTELAGIGGRCLVIHHVDENKLNNDPANWAPSHWGCHTGHHKRGNSYAKGRKRPEKERRNISVALAGRPKSVAHAQKCREAFRKAAHVRWHENRGIVSDDCLLCTQKSKGEACL